VVTVTRTDRLARSTFDLLGIVQRLVDANHDQDHVPETKVPGLQPNPDPNPAAAIITTPIAWIAVVSAISDRPQAQFPISKGSIL